MQVKVTKHTIQEIKDNFEDAIAWLDSIGFPVERGRLLNYRKSIDKVNQTWDVDKWGDINDPENRALVTTVLLEARELTSIYKGFSEHSNPDISNELGHYFKGPVLITDEKASNASNRPRNIGFELYLNALFIKAGMFPIYDTRADMSFQYKENRFFIEAKRPLSEKAVISNIAESNKQLSSRFGNALSKKPKGILALDLSKVINPHNRIMVVENEAQLNALMFNEDKVQIEKLAPYWHRKRHKRTVAVLLHYRVLTNFKPSGDMVTMKWIGFVHLEKEECIVGLNSLLENVIREIC